MGSYICTHKQQTKYTSIIKLLTSLQYVLIYNLQCGSAYVDTILEMNWIYKVSQQNTCVNTRGKGGGNLLRDVLRRHKPLSIEKLSIAIIDDVSYLFLRERRHRVSV